MGGDAAGAATGIGGTGDFHDQARIGEGLVGLRRRPPHYVRHRTGRIGLFRPQIENDGGIIGDDRAAGRRLSVTVSPLPTVVQVKPAAVRAALASAALLPTT